ncbi:MAG: DEAD/DEAH box helicase family protein [Bacilli bacterium]|nr:DEAD/DEAH box helicase family protein [Bacilli bacterium]
MKNEKLERVMLNFDEFTLDSLLKDLKDSLLEWSFEGHQLLTKKHKVQIIVGVEGVGLFNNPSFRKKYFAAIEDKMLFKTLVKLGLNLEIGTQFDQAQLAQELSKIEFSEKPLYTYLIKEHFGIVDYKFDKRVIETPIDIIEKNGSKFFELYDYQYMIKQQVINDLSNPQKDLYRILVHMPTGTGKTKTTMHIISHYINFISKNKGIVVWIAHTNELLHQAYETFLNVWSHLALTNINVYKGWVEFPTELNNGFLFTSIQTLQQKMNKPVFDDLASKASLIVFDEVHKAGATRTKECISRLMKRKNDYGKKFIGLTATPGRTTELSKENTLFVDEFDHIVGIDIDLINSISLTPEEARNYQGTKDPIGYFQENKYLSKINKETLDYDVDDAIASAIKKEMGNKADSFSNELIMKIATNRSRNIKIVERLKKLNEDNIPTIVFACSLQHAKMLSAFLRLLDIENSLVYGDMDPYERKKSISNFKEGKVNIIINYEILTTGFDSTNIKCVFITRPTKSVILYSQMIGRGLRGPKMGGNDTCLLIDVKENLISFNENKAFKHFDKYWKKED